MPRRLFVDLEASSLEPGGCPVELGWCDESGIGDSCLVRPEPAWANRFDPEDAAWTVHGIDPAELASCGVPAGEALTRMLAAAQGRTILVSSPWDGPWLAMLAEASGFPATLTDDFNTACLSDALAEAGIDPEGNPAAAREILEDVRLRLRDAGGSLPAHRALEDAAEMSRLWNACRAAGRAFRQRLPR